MSARRWAWATAAAFFYLVNVFLHLAVTDYLDLLVKRIGFEAYEARLGMAFGGLGVLALGLAWTVPRTHRILIGTAATVLAALVLLAQQLLVVVMVENIHYLQYGLLAALLVPVVRSIEWAWVGAIALGIADEAYQAAALPRGTPGYFDWNDVALNGVGATLGALAMVATVPGLGYTPGSNMTRRVLAGVAIAVVALIAMPPWQWPFWEFTEEGRAYHRLAGFEATILLVGLWLGAVALCRHALPNRPRA